MKTTHFYNATLDKHGVDVTTDKGDTFGIACPDETTARQIAGNSGGTDRPDYPLYTKTFVMSDRVFSYYRVNSETDIFSFRLLLISGYPNCSDNCMANALSGDYQVISKKEFAEALKEFKKLVRQIQP